MNLLQTANTKEKKTNRICKNYAAGPEAICIKKLTMQNKWFFQHLTYFIADVQMAKIKRMLQKRFNLF